jgi:hypothetical protein
MSDEGKENLNPDNNLPIYLFNDIKKRLFLGVFNGIIVFHK